MKESKKFHLNAMPCAQCTVEFVIDNLELTNVRFWSYNTLELDVHKIPDFGGEWLIEVRAYVGYSATTARHINRFTTELFGRNLYHELKKIGIGCYAGYFFTDFEILDFYNSYLKYGKRY